MSEMEAWAVLLCPAFGLMTALRARAIGRRALPWFAAGAVLPLFGLFVLETLDHLHMRKCPHCESPISKTASVCRHCARPVRDQAS